MIKIQLDEKYWLISGTKQYKIGTQYFETNKKGEKIEIYKIKAYCSNLQSAIKSYYDLALLDSSCESFEELIKVGKETKERIENILKKFEEIQ